MDAQLLKSELEASGIDCFIKSDDAGGMMPHLTKANGVTIMIHKENMAIANAILQSRQ